MVVDSPLIVRVIDRRIREPPTVFLARQFIARDVYNEDLDPDNCTYTNRGAFTYLACPNCRCTCCGGYLPDLKSLVVCVDGACRHQGHPQNERSAAGVHFGEGNFRNIGMLLENLIGVTSFRAELIALSMALFQLGEVKETHPEFEEAVIKTSNRLLVEEMTREDAGWRKVMVDPGAVVPEEIRKNRLFFQVLEAELKALRAAKGMGVAFWLVEDYHNQEAGVLIASAINESLYNQ